MSAGRFDINRDFSWVAFGCLLIVLFVFVAAVVVSRTLGPIFALGDRGSPTELVVQNLSASELVSEVTDSAGARFIRVPAQTAVVIYVQDAGAPTPDFVEVVALECATDQRVEPGAPGYERGGTITVDYGGKVSFQPSRVVDSLGQGWSDSGFAT